MKKALILFIALLISNTLVGQSTNSPEPNTTVITLIILNDNGEVLIKRATIGWITIGTFYEQRQTLNEAIASLSNKYGVSISKPELKGVFTYKFGFNNSLSVRQFYVAKSTTNDLPKNKNVEFHWAPKDEAIEKFSGTVPSLGEMVEQILDYPQVVWGGSFLINRENEKTTSEQTEDFYPISDPSAYRTSSSNSLIEKTLQNYMEGSSYNKLEMLESAFTDNATLYLTNKDGLFKLYTPKEYTGFFKNADKDKFNGRYAKILEIEQIKDIATAKVEIAGPEREWVYIDLFLLKKLEDGWKIISKTATRVDDPKQNSVLFILSNAHFYGDTKISTGNSFSEIVNAYDVFKNAGYTVDFVSPKGGAVPLAYINTSDDMSKEYLYDANFMNALKNTKSPSEVIASKYKAVQYIGGGGAMFGVPENNEIQNIVMDVYEKHNGIISSVCHGTAGIVNLKTKDGKYLVEGKKVSGYPDDFENKGEPYFKTFPFLIKKTIQNRGGKFHFSKSGTSHVEVDGRLITGQNYLSSKPVALKVIELINSKKE